MLNRILFISICLLAGLTSGDATAKSALKTVGEAKVVQVVDGDTVLLDRKVNGTREVRLVGIQAPKLPLGRRGFKKWPLADASKQALANMVLDRDVTLAIGGTGIDRHGRLLAHLMRSDGVWIQGAMLAAGMARVYSFPDNRARVGDMLKREGEARAARRGMWRMDAYAIREHTDTKNRIGTFQVVEGRVADAARVRKRVYLNFGDDWRSDFTLQISAKALRLFRKADIDPLAWEGKILRVRGWLKRRNGAMIEVTHPEQIEPLEAVNRKKLK